MRKISLLRQVLVAILVVSIAGCVPKQSKKAESSVSDSFHFNEGLLQIPANESNKIKGQVLYVPIYSNLPFQNEKNNPKKRNSRDLSAVLVIHNTDFQYPVKITRVLFFDNDGNFIRNYADKAIRLRPLGATNFYIPGSDTTGTGANFIVEWIADTLVSEPIVESLMMDMTSHQGISFLSKGKVVRELK